MPANGPDQAKEPPTFAEMAPVTAGSGLDWAIANTIEAYEDIAELPRDGNGQRIEITQGSATSLIQLPDQSPRCGRGRSTLFGQCAIQ